MAVDIGKDNEEDAITFEAAIEAVGSGRFQTKVVLVGGLALLCSYIAIGGIAFVLPAAQCDLQMNSLDKGNLISSAIIGLIISCHMWGFLSDRLGRRYIIIRSIFFDGLLYILTSLVPYYSVIIVLRFLNGIASSGSIVALYAYVGEFHSNKTRIKGLMIMSVLGFFCFIMLPVVAWLLLSGKWSFVLYPGLVYKPWRLYYAVLGLPSLTCCLLLYFLPESPKFLVAKGDKKGAIKVLQKIYNENNNIKDQQQLFSIKNIKMNESEMLTKVDKNANKILAFLSLMWNQTAPLFQRPNRTCMVLISVTQYLLYMCFGGIFLWLPETTNRLAIFKEENVNQPATYCQVVQYKSKNDLLNTNLTEVNELITFNDAILLKGNNNGTETCSEDIDFSVYIYSEFLGLLQFFSCIFMLILVKYFDKRYVVSCCILLSFCGGLCLLYLNFIDTIPVIASCVVVLISLTIPTLNSAVVELFPTNLRAMSSCLVLMFSRIGTVTANTLSGNLIDSHCSPLVWIFVVSFVVCFVLVLLLPKKPPYIQEEENRLKEIKTNERFQKNINELLFC